MKYDKETIRARNPIKDVVGEVVELKQVGTSLQGLCPFHDDRNPSFTVYPDQGKWKCFGCDKGGDVFNFVMLLEGLDFKGALEYLANHAGIGEQTSERHPHKVGDEYIYHNENGLPYFKTVRIGDGNGKKSFSVYRRDGNDWRSGLNGQKPILYHLPQVISADEIHVAEGEKCADALTSIGLIGTTNPFGAGKWRNEYAEVLAGKHVTIHEDNDEPGRNHARTVAASLFGKAAEVRIVSYNDLHEKGDVADYLKAHTKEELLAHIATSLPIKEAPQVRTARNVVYEAPSAWNEPIPLGVCERPAQIPADALPPALAEIVDHISRRVQVPVELPTAVALSVLSTAIGSRAIVDLGSHTETPPIWTCVVMEPGARKSSVFAQLTAPLVEAEAELQEEWKKAHRQWKAEADIEEESYRNCKRTAQKAAGFEREDIRRQMIKAQEVMEKEPPCPQLWTEDTTSESLRKLLADNGSIGVLSAEGGSVFEGFGRYSGAKGADLGVWLSGHAGDPGKATRVSGHVSSRRQILSVGLTAQEHALQTIGADRTAQGRGFLARFGWFLPPDSRGKRNYNQEPVSPAIMTKWGGMVRRILSLPKEEEPAVVKLTPSARAAWILFATEIERRQGEAEDLHHLPGWASKLAGLAGRIALAYHFAAGGCVGEPIAEEMVNQAILLCRSLIEHAKAAFRLIGEDEGLSTARYLLAHIKKNEWKEVAPWQVARRGWAGCDTAAKARQVLTVLEKYGYLRAIARDPSKPGRPPEGFEVNPLTLSPPEKTEITEKKESFLGFLGFLGPSQTEKKPEPIANEVSASLPTPLADEAAPEENGGSWDGEMVRCFADTFSKEPPVVVETPKTKLPEDY